MSRPPTSSPSRGSHDRRDEFERARVAVELIATSRKRNCDEFERARVAAELIATSRAHRFGVVIPIVTAEEMGAIDASAPVPVEELIGRAGRAVARSAVVMLGGTYGRVVNVIAGAGNNGADGRTAAESLRRRGVLVRVFEAASCPVELPPADLVIDAAFGTGYRWSARDDGAQAGARKPWASPGVGESPVLAVDIPSGLDSLTGRCHGEVLAADRTVTFQAMKPGLLFADGPGLSGDVEVVDIGLDASAATVHLVERADVVGWWPQRGSRAHKWNTAVRIIAGSVGMLGAARLCSAAALRSGAGLVSLSAPGCAAGGRNEVIEPPVAESGWADDVLVDLARFGALVVGPGLGRREATIEATRRVIADATVPLVVDGDALFAAAWSADGPVSLLRSRVLPTVITPHDGEFALLTGAPPGDDRVEAARRLAFELGCTVLLKGPTTVVAGADGEVLVVDHGDERLATAGSGDVLAGMIGTLLASGVPPLQAAASVAWVHAEAGCALPMAGLVAGDLVERLPETLSSLRSSRPVSLRGASR